MRPIVAGRVAQLRRAEILECLEGLLGASPEPLRLIVRDVQGLGGPIDAVACDATGTPVLIGIATPDGAADPLGSLLAQRAWLAPRIRDWLQLNPQLPFRPDVRPRMLLLAGQWEAATLAAAAEIGVELGRLRALETVEGTVVGLETPPERASSATERPPLERASFGPERTPPEAPPPEPATPPLARPDSGFRTGLRAEDLDSPSRPRSAPRGR
ncbi:MAG: hypothetical protein OEP95_07545 [Myxococcales bacterium]|nr:hypothetical protein [Myxococcales bacterium]